MSGHGFASGGIIRGVNTWPVIGSTTTSFAWTRQSEYEETPAIAEHIKGDMYGYRSWCVVDTELYSLLNGNQKPWEPGKQTAYCIESARHDMIDTPDHTVPEYRCSCGYFAYWAKGPDQGNPLYNFSIGHTVQALVNSAEIDTTAARNIADEYGPLYDNLNLHAFSRNGYGTVVSGVVRASGNVIMHEYGFRSQFLEILALSPLPHPAWKGHYDSCQQCGPWGWMLPELLHGAGTRYGVPTFETFDDLYREYPPTHKNEPKTDKPDW